MRAGAAERAVARLLFWGGVLSLMLIVVGMLWYAVSGGPHGRLDDVARIVENREAGRPPDVFTSLGQIARGLGRRPVDPVALVALGVVVLLVVPAGSVALALIGFHAEGDRDFVVISAAVLLLLVVGVAIAAVG